MLKFSAQGVHKTRTSCVETGSLYAGSPEPAPCLRITRAFCTFYARLMNGFTTSNIRSFLSVNLLFIPAIHRSYYNDNY